MARTRKTEQIKVTAVSAAAPARRKTASAPRTGRPVEVTTPAIEVATPAIEVATKAPAGEAVVEAPAVVLEAAAIQYVPASDEISSLAYSYWVARGYQAGSQEEDWLRAEQELLQRAV